MAQCQMFIVLSLSNMEAQYELYSIISVTIILAICPRGLSLLYESGHTLLTVIGGKGGVEQPFLKSQPLLQWQFLIFFMFYQLDILNISAAVIKLCYSYFTYGRHSKRFKSLQTD